MINLQNNNKNFAPLRLCVKKKGNNKGFTLIEVMMVMIILGILAQLSMSFALDLRSRAYDSTAIVDARNLLVAIGNNFISLDLVDYTYDSAAGQDVGTPSVFTLSPGVRLSITGGSASTGDPADDFGFFEAMVYHAQGSDDSTGVAASGKKEFYIYADGAGLITVPE